MYVKIDSWDDYLKVEILIDKGNKMIAVKIKI